jgi:lipopolysaccharide transport system ATP-binding protein
MSDIAIQIDHVWKKFRKGEVHDSLRELIPALFRRMLGKTVQQQNLKASEFWALKDVSFQLKRGESLGIIGPNGAGKSTMLKVLSRILKPNRGSYSVKGRVASLIEVGAGFHPDLTGRENIYLNGTILGMTRKEIKAKEEAIIDFSGIEGFIDTPVKRYSSGMGARLGFAVAAHLQTDVLLVDEVLSVGDARFRHKCVRHMNELLRSGITVVFISHILDQVRSLCPRTLVLDKGQVAYDGETDGAIRRYLDLLGSPEAGDAAGADSPVEIRDMRLCNQAGQEVPEWRVGEPCAIEFELVVHVERAAEHVAINISTLGGVYVGTIHSSRQIESMARHPGVYRVRLDVPVMPLDDGDYGFEFQVFGYDEAWNYKTFWHSRQPRVVAVRGPEAGGQIVRFAGQWQVTPGVAREPGLAMPAAATSCVAVPA